MTRATLLHVLDCPTDLGPAEVRELEQLAQAFPYCQTAHLLLAKAAHDQGTMLAGQRLRRAATYAADRTLLRRLIEQAAPIAEPAVEPAAELVTEVVAEEAAEPASPPLPPPAVAPYYDTETAVPSGAAAPLATAAPVVPLLVAPVPPPAPAPAPEPQPLPPPAVLAPDAPVAVEAMALQTLPVQKTPPMVLPVPVVELTTTPLAVILPAAPILEATPEPNMEVAPAVSVLGEALPLPTPAAGSTPIPDLPEPTPTVVPVVVPPAEIALVETAVAAPEAPPAAVELPALLIDQEDAAVAAKPLLVVVPPALVAAPAPEAAPAASPEAEETAPTTLSEAEELAPPQAPAIRPPVEVGEARFEFGLGEPVTVAKSAYELPGLVDEWAASAVTRGLGTPEALILPVEKAGLVPPVFTSSAFTGDAELGYGFGESSRLGFSLQPLHLLTDAAELAAGQGVTAQSLAAALPPAGAFFEPDPLLQAYWAAHRPAAPELPSTLDLINNFLKRQPRLTRAGMLPSAPGGQPDLSVRSTRAEPDLVSENLARIFVRQGKTARAIEIYEKLIVKQPEKMAYFTAQIQQLQPSA